MVNVPEVKVVDVAKAAEDEAVERLAGEVIVVAMRLLIVVERIVRNDVGPE